MSNRVALDSYLSAFQPYFDMPHVTEICVNQPYDIWIEQAGRFTRHDAPHLSEGFLMQFAQLVAESNQREISREHPTLSSTLPNGLRVQFVIEPACQQGSFICSIRQKSQQQFPLSHYFSGETAGVKPSGTGLGLTDENALLLDTYLAGDYETFLTLAVIHRKNIIISGGTSTGKTTVLNSLLQSVPSSERLVTIETDREVMCAHPNVVHLLAAQEGKSVADITMLGLLKSALRLRPDRLLVSELRAEEAFVYLRAVSSGHPGSITTLHADSPMNCFNQLAFMVLQGRVNLTHADILAYTKSIIHVVVQMKRTAEGQRIISEIYFDLVEQHRQPHVVLPSPVGRNIYSL